MNAIRCRPAGAYAVLLEVDGLRQVQALYAALLRQPLLGISDIVPAESTVLLIGPRAAALAAQACQWSLDAPDTADEAPAIDVPVVYDGADLAELQQLTGLDREGLIAAHSGSQWTVAFCGFAPGFAYLSGGVAQLGPIPRLPTPRPRVPAGAVALADRYCGIYPRESPGGWRLLGRTAAPLWDLSRARPALLTPGARVRFRPVQAL